MNRQAAQLLEKHFDTAFAAPDGIRKLRALILTLAMKGKLVPQDPDDQPASVLLREIAAEKRRLVVGGKIKAPNSLTEIKQEEVPYELPVGWNWVRFGAVVQILNGRAYKQNELLDAGMPVLRVGNLFTSNHWYYSTLSLDDNKYIDSGDLIYAWSASFGPFIWEGERSIYHYHIWKLNFFLPERPLKKYLYNYLLEATDKIKRSGSGIAMIHMTKERMEKLLVPLPPLAEQHRIVAKIDQLMTRCDELEMLRAERDKKRLTVHTAALSRLLEPSSPSLSSSFPTPSTSFPRRRESSDSMPEKTGSPTESLGDDEQFSTASDAWRFITQHFGELYSVKENVAELRKAIIQLAVMGKLVPQDPHDQPAGELLKEISAEKRRLMKEGKIKAPKPLPEIKPEEVPYGLPSGWEWVRLGFIGEFINGDRGKNYPNREEYVADGIPWINTGHIEPDGSLTQKEMNYITRAKFNSLNSGKIQSGDLVYCLRGATFGKTAIVDPYKEGAIASSLMIIRLYPPCSNRYLYRYLVSPVGRSQIFKFDNGSAQPNLSANSVRLYVFPIPPLAEQHRIVTKIDQLMALCDRLEIQIDAAANKQRTLLNTVMAQV